MANEKRAFKRTRYFGEVEMDDLVRARLADLSPDGAFIESHAAFSPGTVVQLRFSVLGREVETAAEVRHCCPDVGMGVKFLSLDPGIRAEIARLLAGHEARADWPAAAGGG